MGYHHYSFAFTGNSQGNGNSKLFWFVLGGIAATAWFKIKERRQISGYKCRRALASSGESSLIEGAELRERLCDVDIGTSEAVRNIFEYCIDRSRIYIYD
jgi:hypothetical protein